MVSGDKIVVDADELLRRIDLVRGLLDELSIFLVRGLTTEPPAPTRQRKTEKASEGQPFELAGFNINAVDWKTKDSGPAGPNEGWSWAFSTDVEGYVLPETAELVQACRQYGEVQVGPYLIKIGGRDNNLLNRRRGKK